MHCFDFSLCFVGSSLYELSRLQSPQYPLPFVETEKILSSFDLISSPLVGHLKSCSTVVSFIVTTAGIWALDLKICKDLLWSTIARVSLAYHLLFSFIRCEIYHLLDRTKMNLLGDKLQGECRSTQIYLDRTESTQRCVHPKSTLNEILSNDEKMGGSSLGATSRNFLGNFLIIVWSWM